jgi:hypothetical protein
MVAHLPESEVQQPQGLVLLHGGDKHSNRPLGIDFTYKASTGTSGQPATKVSVTRTLIEPRFNTDMLFADAVVGIFLIGGIAVIASMIRLHALWAYFNSKDPGYDAIGVSCTRCFPLPVW